jgi:hypothetical protein
VDRSGRNEQDLAGFERHWSLALDLVFQQAFDDVDDLFAGMAVRGNATPGAKSTRTCTTSRPGTSRSCRWRSVRLTSGCCDCAWCSAKLIPAISTATAMIRAVHLDQRTPDRRLGQMTPSGVSNRSLPAA